MTGRRRSPARSYWPGRTRARLAPGSSPGECESAEFLRICRRDVEIKAAILDHMSQEMRAHVKDGTIVLDEPIELPEGTELRVMRVDTDAVEPALEAAIEEGFSDFENGHFDDAQEFAHRLASRH
jgi:hypothetical protein